jgi:hypothetical protein
VPTATSSGRRTALANWIVSPQNPLTARVFVNRIWAQYFGHGIVETVSDFGKMGAKPTNPELLDYLAANFVNDGWSVKKLHREILLSSVYRESSAERRNVEAADPGDKLLSSFPRKRLDAEEIRDSLLLASGLLEEKMGGPAVFPPIPPGLQLGTPWKASEDPHDHNRRSVYVFIRRNSPYPLLDAFDWANPQLVHSTREVSTTAPQALTLANSDLVFQWSQALAARVINEAGKNESAQLDRLYQIAYSRLPTKQEKSTLLAFLDSQEKVAQKQIAKGKKVATPEGFGEKPELKAELDALYKTEFGRSADRYEKAQFVAYLETQKKKHAKPDDEDADSDGASPASDSSKDSVKEAQDPKAARAAAFVSLVHAVANSNEFNYRF